MFLLVLKRKDLRGKDGFYFSNIEQVSSGEAPEALVATGGSTGGGGQGGQGEIWAGNENFTIQRFLGTTGRVLKRTSSHTPPWVIFFLGHFLLELVW